MIYFEKSNIIPMLKKDIDYEETFDICFYFIMF